MHWQTSRFSIDLSRPRVMGIVNATPDSFFDGGRHASLAAVSRGAAIVRVHDVAATIDALKIWRTAQRGAADEVGMRSDSGAAGGKSGQER